MAFITLAGTLRDPTSELAVGDQIRFTHKSTTGETVEGAVSVLTIDPSGTYSKDLQYGLVLVEYKDVRTSQFKNLGVATVNGSNPATSIPELLNALVPVSSAELIEFQAILADAVTARNEAEAFANSIDLINDLSQTYIFDTAALFKSSTILFPDGKRIYLADRDAYFTKISGQSGGGFGKIPSATLSQSIDIIDDGAATAKNYGAIGGGVINDSSALIDFSSAKPAGTVRNIQNETYKSTTGNYIGVLFVADGNGNITDNTTANVINKTKNNDYYPNIVSEKSPSFIVENSANLLLVCTPSNSQAGYILHSLVNNITTTDLSLATSASDTTSWRINRVQHAVFACVGFNTFNSSVGTWSSVGMTQVDPSMPTYNSSRAYNYIQNNSNSSDSITYTGIVVVDGFIDMTFASTAGSNAACEITVDGTLYTVNLTQSAGEFLEFKFPVIGKKSVSVVIENTSLGAFNFVNFLGFNFRELKDYSGAAVDEYGYYRNTAIWDEYSSPTSNSENNYTIKEFNSDTYGGGYHGGESAITNVFKDGSDIIVPSSFIIAASNLKLETKCTVDWTPAGDSTAIELTKKINFIHSGYTEEIIVDGNISAIQEFSTLFGVNETFDKIKSPIVGSIDSLVADTERLLVGKTNNVIMESATGQGVRFDITQFVNDNGNQYGGVNIWRVDGSYKKVYYSKAHGVKGDFTNGIYSSKKVAFY